MQQIPAFAKKIVAPVKSIAAYALAFAKKRAEPIALIAIIALLPLFMEGQYFFLIFSLIGIYIIATSGLDILFGYSGQISLGQAGFYGIGAYGSAMLSRYFGWDPWLTMIIASSAASLVGFLFALPTTRLKFMFLSLVTTAFGELIYQVVVNFWPDVTGGTTGFHNIPKINLLGVPVQSRMEFFFIVIVLVIIFLFIKQRIVHSRAGRAFVAIRENDIAAGAMGINVVKNKAIAFAIGAFYSAFAGGLYAHMVGYISPESFTRPLSLMFLTIVLFGGRGSFIGPIIGAIILSVIKEAVQSFGQYQQLIYGAFIIITVLFMPRGIAGAFDRIKSLKELKRNVA